MFCLRGEVSCTPWRAAFDKHIEMCFVNLEYILGGAALVIRDYVEKKNVFRSERSFRKHLQCGLLAYIIGKRRM